MKDPKLGLHAAHAYLVGECNMTSSTAVKVLTDAFYYDSAKSGRYHVAYHPLDGYAIYRFHPGIEHILLKGRADGD